MSKSGNKREDSYYRTYTTQNSRPIQLRISNHGTHLWTWYDKDYDPSYAINYCIVFSENGAYDSKVEVDMKKKDKQGNVIGERKPFEVVQYVYNSQLLDNNDAALINQTIQTVWQSRAFVDPFANTPKHAKVMKLKPNEPIEILVENKQYQKTEHNMRQNKVRLTESRLRGIIREAVKSVIYEDYKRLKQLYYNLIQSIDAFLDFMDDQYDMKNSENIDVYQTIMSARDKIEDFVQHPEVIRNEKVWDNIDYIA